MLLVWHQWPWSPKADWEPVETREANKAMLHIYPSDQTNSVWSDIEPQAKKDDTHLSHMAPIYKSLGHLDRFLGERERKMGTQQVEGRKTNGWTQRKSQGADQHSLPTWLSDPGSWPCKWGEKVMRKWGNGPMAKHDDQAPGRHHHKRTYTNETLNDQQS